MGGCIIFKRIMLLIALFIAIPNVPRVYGQDIKGDNNVEVGISNFDYRAITSLIFL